LQGMLEKGKKEKHDEQVLFAAEKQSCSSIQAEKATDIKENGQKIGGLTADIEKDVSDVNKLAKEIAGLEKDISVLTGDKKATSTVRNMDKADFQKMHRDYSESIDAVSRAIAVLKTKDIKQGAALVHVAALQKLSLIPANFKKAIDGFMQESDDSEAPEANAYESKSGGVVDMLSKLHAKFAAERTNLEAKEVTSRNAFELLSQDLSAQIKQAGKDAGEKAVTKAKTLKHKADASSDMESTSALKADDEKYLKDLTSSCSLKASDFEARQQLRAEEIQVLEKTISIIAGSAVSGGASKHLPGLLQVQRKTSFSQLRSNINTQMQERVSQYLEDRAATLNSRVLAAVAERAGADPMAKVVKMIKGMVTKLLKEANTEAGHKGWCDTELGENKQTRTDKSDGVATLSAQIESLTSAIAKTTDDIAKLGQEVAALDAAMAEGVRERADEKSKNSATVKDAQDAQTALAQALTVLKEFYSKAGAATAFVQQKAPYHGQNSGGVMGLLDVIATDFARLESDTNSAEASAQKAHDNFVTDSKTSRATKSAQTESKKEKLQDKKQELTIAQSDLESTQKQLSTALDYFAKLKPSCIAEPVSYEDRVAKRNEEIESLQNSLKIFEGDDLA